MRGRYAPSPTGYLHLGNARTALVAYWQARKKGGDFVMRVEDLDSLRTKPDMIDINLAELRWLGLEWDEGPDVGGVHAPYLQSQRHALYQEALDKLQAGGHLFECYLSRKDLREIASAPHGGSSNYGELERQRNQLVKTQKQAEGKTPSLRFKVDRPVITFTDTLQGEQSFEIGDFIVKRADQEWAYQLAVVVDDIAMNINKVVRGDDLLESTAAQLLLYEALDASPPEFLHVPLVLDAAGERMSKRNDSLTLTSVKEAGVAADRLVGLLAYSLGMIKAPRVLGVVEGLKVYDQSKLSPTPFTLTPELLDWLYAAT